MENNLIKNKKTLLFVGIFSILILSRILLITGIPKMYIPGKYDDLFYAKAAHHLIRGRWMGPYDQMTLIKGPFYAVFLVFSFLTGLPLFVNETLFYIFACVLLFFAFKPLIRNQWWRLLLFSILLFCPASLATGWNLRVYREFVNLSLTLYITAFSIGLFLRINQKLSSIIFWVVGLGLSTGAFILTREEGVWIYPVLFLLLLAAVWQVWNKDISQKWTRTTLILLPLLISYVPILIVSLLNYTNYGFWGYSENLDKDYFRIRNILCSIETSSVLPHRPISKEALSEAYNASPYLSNLSDYIDAKFDEWRTPSDEVISLKPNWYKEKYFIEGQDLGNSYFIWLLRDALAANGYYSEGKFPSEYIEAIADQLENACDNGTLKCRHNAQIPLVGPIKAQNIPIILHYFVDDIYKLFKFDGGGSAIFSLDVRNWREFKRETMNYFEEFAYNPIRYQLFGNPEESVRVVGNNTDIRLKILPIKEKMMLGIYSIYKLFTLPLTIILIVVCVVLLIRNRNKKPEDRQAFLVFIFALSLLFTRLMTLAIIDATTDNPGFSYSASNHLFIEILLFLMIYFLCKTTERIVIRNWN